jgi:hypothetical protein
VGPRTEQPDAAGAGRAVPGQLRSPPPRLGVGPGLRPGSIPRGRLLRGQLRATPLGILPSSRRQSGGPPRGRRDAVSRSLSAPNGWPSLRTLHIPDWCGCSTEYLPVPVGEDGGRWSRSGSPARRPTRCGGGRASFAYSHVETPTGGDHRLTTNFTIVPPLNEPRPLRR